ncbi:NAD(P)/FAD-dependent oxidoreductase [Sporanaerobacter sp. PP17-6a]|uniref:NAD(P)/FAD-dependent oxidoreductase n=1 Tax=Sporanaerobacter sp. PP17-6a TaxID=1891289 RepID=UPI0008A07688|nr:NAD(P)/FAD-dependent oxidoreductase [Sporanaerobacter sp. PP17-6a]SCL89723.1 tricarballylate dehydrogenase [Sporanaerobacter sp. PP17-6a]
MSKKIIVIGGGASGMIAAIAAKRKGALVTILERNPRVGKKILATGNGRCNYTNMDIDIKNYHGENPEFARYILSQFGADKTIDFFEKLGITPTVEEGGKVFPMSLQSSSVLDVLRMELEELKVETICDFYVKSVKKIENGFIVRSEKGTSLRTDKIILATGGKSMPSSGSDGNGYELSRSLGHKITNIFPGLVQLKTEERLLKEADGVKIIGNIKLANHGCILREERGDILFTNYGISGPPVLQISREALELINMGQNPVVIISIINDRTKEELREYLKKRFNYKPKRTMEESLIGLINKRLIGIILKKTEIDRRKSSENITRVELEKIVNILTNWEMKIIGSKSFPSCQITAGGVSTDEINSKTLESKIVKGLYFSGELIDIDGDCGGFNLQWAWASGYIAGENAALD